jgi:small subunit ribosomal protein S8e
MYHGKITLARKKRKYSTGGVAAETGIGKVKNKVVGTKGGNTKVKIIKSDFENVVLDGKSVKCKIVDLTSNPANKDFTRRRVITKGAILKVTSPDGKELSVRVTSRPGQAGVIDAILA